MTAAQSTSSDAVELDGAVAGLDGNSDALHEVVAGLRLSGATVLGIAADVADYARVGVSLGPHPMQQVRAKLRAARCIDAKTLRTRPHNSHR